MILKSLLLKLRCDDMDKAVIKNKKSYLLF